MQHTDDDASANQALLQKKLDEALIQINALNVSVAEPMLNDIKKADPAFPGLDAAFSRLEQIKMQIMSQQGQ
jgi:hypothetical protein